MIWAFFFFSLSLKTERKNMLVVSFWTSLLGLTEPLFVPEYWNPMTLFNLARRTGFDLESLIFCFAIGGIAFVLYGLIFKTGHQQTTAEYRHLKVHRYHRVALFSAPIIFVVLFIFSNLNPIYSGILAMLVGGLATWYCRPDLKKKMFISAFIFFFLYLFYFLILNTISPGYVEEVWNLKAISGILIIGIPLEELMFAFAFGFLWSSIYEHFTWKKLSY